MIAKVLKVGDKVEMIKISTRLSEEKPRLYNSRLLEIKDDTKMHIAIPIEGGKIIPLEIGDKYELRFVTSSGIYKCKSEIANRCKQGNIYFFIMNIQSELQKDQRRQYFRLEKIKEIKFHKLNNEETMLLNALCEKRYKDDLERRTILNRLLNIKSIEYDGTVSNISGGGVKFHSREELCKDDYIRLYLQLEDTDPEPLDLFARVVGTEYIHNQNMHNEHRIEFVNMNRDTRERIVKYVFTEDRKQRQKEKGLD